ncbi:hypothetical protein LCGC14_1394740, partial [marine sediment metagenome]
LLSGKLPARFEIQHLEDMFGSELAKTILGKRPGGAKAWENILDAMNLPRAVLASWDLSAPLRQGATLFWGQPRESLPAFKPMLQAFLSEDTTRIIDDNTRTGKFAELREQAGLFHAELFGVAPQLTAREENFMSRFAQKVPMVRRSERAFATYLNKLRADVFDSYAQQWEGTGKTLKDYKALASAINILSGRGPLGALSKSAPILSAIFFSPRYQASRISLPIEFFRTNSAVRKIMARNILAFVSANLTILSLMALAGVDIEDDPRSADFGKGKIGNNRLDFWAGFQQYSRAIAQIITGMRQSTITGTLTEVERDELIINFVRGKFSPVFGLVSDIIKNETFEGDEFKAEPEFVKEQFFNRLVPIFIQDIVEAVEESGIAGALISLPGLFGVGIQTYGASYWDEFIDKLGLPESTDTLPYSANVEDIFTTKDFYAAIQPRVQGLTVEDLTPNFGFPELVKSAVEAKNTKVEWQDRPNTSLVKINNDITEGDTFEHFFLQWQELQKLTDEEEIAEFKGDHPQYFQGNFTRRELALIREYHTLNPEAQKAFIELHPELGTKPRIEWLKDNPNENALLALWGQAPVRSIEAYNRMQVLIEELDIPDAAIPEFTLPPRESVDNYFSYLDAGEEFSFNSWEVQLIVAEDDALRVWLGRQPIETPTASLEIKISNRELTEEYDALETDEDRDAFRLANQDWVDDQRRVEAIENGGSEQNITDWVDRGNVVDQFESGSSEAKVWLLDNPKVHKWALEQELLTDDGSDWNENVLRINVKWRKDDDAYKDLTSDELRAQYLIDNPEYHRQRRFRDAYSIDFPEEHLETYVNWYTDTSLDKPDNWPTNLSWYEDDWFLIENPEFYRAMLDKGVFTERKDFRKVPSRRVFALYSIYLNLPSGTLRLDYRRKHGDLDDWLVLSKGYKPATGQISDEEELSRWERLAKDIKELMARPVGPKESVFK